MIDRLILTAVQMSWNSCPDRPFFVISAVIRNCLSLRLLAVGAGLASDEAESLVEVSENRQKF